MTATKRLGLAALLAGAVGVGLAQAPRAGAEEALKPAAPMRVGLVESLFRDTPAPLVQAIMKPFKALMESQTGLSGHLVPGIAADDLGQQLKDDKVQLGVFHGFEFAWARQRHPELKPLMIAVNQQRYLRAHVLVRDDCPATCLADLKGKTLAVARRTREHCHLFVERRLRTCGATAKEFFGRVVTPNSAEDAIDGVVSGLVTAVLADGVALDWYRERKPTRAPRLKTLEQSEVFPASVVAYRASALDDATLRRFRHGMITAKDNPRGQQLMALCQITSFEPIPDDFEQLLTDIVKAYPVRDK